MFFSGTGNDLLVGFILTRIFYSSALFSDVKRKQFNFLVALSYYQNRLLLIVLMLLYVMKDESKSKPEPVLG